MTLRYFYQRNVKTNLKFRILIFVIALTARLIECDDEATEAPAGEGATDGASEEPEVHDHEKIYGVKCEELTKENEHPCSDVEAVVEKYKNTKCIVCDDDVKFLCALIKRCPESESKIQDIYKHSVYEEPEHVFHKRNKTDALSCIGHLEGGNGQMLSSSLWLIFTVVGGLMILFRL